MALCKQPGEMRKDGAVEDDGQRFEAAVELDCSHRRGGKFSSIKQIT